MSAKSALKSILMIESPKCPIDHARIDSVSSGGLVRCHRAVVSELAEAKAVAELGASCVGGRLGVWGKWGIREKLLVLPNLGWRTSGS